MGQETVETIHESLVNGQRQQAVKQIQKYGVYDFWSDYEDYLSNYQTDKAYSYFADMTKSFFRITER